MLTGECCDLGCLRSLDRCLGFWCWVPTPISRLATVGEPCHRSTELAATKWVRTPNGLCWFVYEPVVGNTRAGRRMAGIFDAPTPPVREHLFIVHENDPFITGRDPLDLPTDYLKSLEFVKLRRKKERKGRDLTGKDRRVIMSPSDVDVINPPTRYAGGGWIANPSL